MKINRLIALILGALPAAAGFAAADSDSSLGNVMYVGDSITHGVNSASYRWALFKIFTDNGITQNEVGVNSGNYSGGVSAGTVYGGAVFANVHSAISSERAYEVAGTKNTSGRLGNSNIRDWLGLDDTYTGSYQIDTATEMPDMYFLMIGTNDLLSDNSHISTNYDSTAESLLGTYDSEAGTWSNTGSMYAIISAMLEASGEDTTIVITTIPTWLTGRSNNNYQADFETVEAYNETLKSWAAYYSETYGYNIVIAEVNTGMTDAAAGYWQGVSSMFGSDGLHPSAQGDLIIAGNIAKALGYAGRTAGQTRKAASDFGIQAAAIHAGAETTGTVTFDSGAGTFSMETGSALVYTWDENVDLSTGYTVDLTISGGIGDGSENGWLTSTDSAFTITVGDGTLTGTLSISEAYIQWGDTVLYSLDTSTDLTDSLRIAYIYGNTAQGLTSGFYVWLDDMLIGEALAGTASDYSGLAITNNTGGTVNIGSLSLDSTGSYAPATTGITYGNPAIESSIVTSSGEGAAAWPDSFDSYTEGISTGTNIRTQIDSSTGSGGTIGGVISSGNAANGVQVNKSSYTGDIYITMTGTTTSDSSKWNALHTYNGAASTLTGSVSLRFDSAYTSTSAWGTMFGAVGSATYAVSVEGSVYMEFSSQSYTNTGGTFNGVTASVAGAYCAAISGSVTLVFNAGSFSQGIYGGSINNASSSVGSTAVYLNAGYFCGDIYAGGSTGTITGDTALSITGNDVYTNGVATISSGGTGGTIHGNTTLTLSNLTADGAFAAYTGALSGTAGAAVSGTKTLVIDNVQLPSFGASLENFDTIVITGENTDIGLTSLGGAGAVQVTGISAATSVQDCSLVLAESTQAGAGYASIVMNEGGSIHVTGTLTLNLDAELTARIIADLTGANGEEADAAPQAVSLALTDAGETADTETATLTGTLLVASGTLTMAEGAVITVNLDETAGSGWLVTATGITQEDGCTYITYTLTALPEPSSAALGLLACAVLAARRRRKN
ncbi:MAG: SGNH/GDSL hydrolase family protein [Akkermansiaceae bacterium]|nr:SGNH/GDSL hydrolase family protein [Akkermansiaceae bacterium]